MGGEHALPAVSLAATWTAAQAWPPAFSSTDLVVGGLYAVVVGAVMTGLHAVLPSLVRPRAR